MQCAVLQKVGRKGSHGRTFSVDFDVAALAAAVDEEGALPQHPATSSPSLSHILGGCASCIRISVMLEIPSF